MRPYQTSYIFLSYQTSTNSLVWMAWCAAHQNQHLINSDDAIGVCLTQPIVSWLTLPTCPWKIPQPMDPINQVSPPRHTSEEPQHIETQFSDFCMDHMSINVQVDLENLQSAHVILNETLLSRMDALDRELGSQMNELKELQNAMHKFSLIPGWPERDQALTEELLFNHKNE